MDIVHNVVLDDDLDTVVLSDVMKGVWRCVLSPLHCAKRPRRRLHSATLPSVSQERVPF
jgi:hypothetical protein